MSSNVSSFARSAWQCCIYLLRAVCSVLACGCLTVAEWLVQPHCCSGQHAFLRLLS